MEAGLKLASQLLENYGLAAVFCLGLMAVIVYLIRTNAKERRENNDRHDAHFNTVITAMEQQREVIKEQTEVNMQVKEALKDLQIEIIRNHRE